MRNCIKNDVKINEGTNLTYKQTDIFKIVKVSAKPCDINGIYTLEPMQDLEWYTGEDE